MPSSSTRRPAHGRLHRRSDATRRLRRHVV
jgi:hypothetical protein